MPRRVIIASGNRHKVGELQRAIAGLGGVGEVEVLAASELGPLPEVVEDRETFEGNATLKALGFAAWLRGLGEEGASLVVADDSGLCVDALEGAPGVYSARFAGPGASDADNNQRLCDELRARGLDSSPAHYVCALAVGRVDGGALPGQSDEGVCVFRGRWDGVARTVARGSGGFGYDPFVWLGGGARTVAELTPEEKGARSHRGAATAAFLAALPGLLAG
ncbi:MAG: non-canonical purine NTP pyrophosphatase [Myxococcales bacterium]|nr:non-canonical purine NTP pyrophosphatase [Myxococcales bacterium]